MTHIGSPSNSNTVDRRSQSESARSAGNVSSQGSEKAAAVVAPVAAAAVEALARTPAAATIVDAARAKAAGAEDATRNRVLAKNDDAPAAGQVRRGLQRSADDACPIMDLVDRGEHTPAELLEEVRGKGSGKGIDYDGPNCAPDPNQIIEV